MSTEKILWEVRRENLQLMQIVQAFMKVVFDLGLERWAKGGQLSSWCEQSAGLTHGWQVLPREWSLGCGKGTVPGAECVSKGNLPGANGKARVGPDLFHCAVRTGPTGEGPGLGPRLAGGGSACLCAQWGCRLWGLAPAAYGCGHRSMGGWCGKREQAMAGCVTGSQKGVSHNNRKSENHSLSH